jgi:hypothetical protein
VAKQELIVSFCRKKKLALQLVQLLTVPLQVLQLLVQTSQTLTPVVLVLIVPLGHCETQTLLNKDNVVSEQLLQ